MNRKLLIAAVFLCACTKVTAQERPHKISFELGYGINTYEMDDLNAYYINLFAASPAVNILNDEIKRGQHFRLGLNYKPLESLEVGLYGGYQYGRSKYGTVFQEFDAQNGHIAYHKGTYAFTTEALTAGASATWYFSGLMGLQRKTNALNKLHLGLELSAGAGFSRAVADMRYPTYPIISVYDFRKSTDFQGQAGVKIEFDFVKSPFVTTLGVRVGYQYFRTGTLKDNTGQDWTVLGQHPINLDFSGAYFGAYVKLGK